MALDLWLEYTQPVEQGLRLVMVRERTGGGKFVDLFLLKRKSAGGRKEARDREIGRRCGKGISKMVTLDRGKTDR